MKGRKGDAFTGNDVDYHCGLYCLSIGQFQAFGGNQIMTMGILFWLCAGVVCFAMMQTIFRLLLKNSNSKF
jgi:hypothetical protein